MALVLLALGMMGNTLPLQWRLRCRCHLRDSQPLRC
jgi:hypothetical protein